MKKSINNWFKKNTEEEEKVFRQGLLAYYCSDTLKSI